MPISAPTAPPKYTIVDYLRVRAFTERLCEPLAIEDYGLQTVLEASPPKWHLAHVSWFFETFLLVPFLPGYTSFHPRFDYLFNSYYEQTGSGFWPRAERGLLSRPTVAEVYEYRRHVDAGMERLLADSAARHPEVRARLAIGLHHEQQHQELLVTDIKRHLAYNPLRPAYRAELLPVSHATPPPALTFAACDGGMTAIGAPATAAFAYDNEYPRHDVYLAPYRLAERLTTNAEYLQFVEDNAYMNPALWLADGWATVRRLHWQAPLYWERIDGVWHEMTLGGLAPLVLAAPVTHVSYYETEAFARWAGCRLPTEAEWEQAATGSEISGNFVEEGYFHPRPARTEDGLRQLFGDCWEWTGSAYLPYPGYRPQAGALGEYNGKFMCNQMVLRGGSCASSRDHLRPSYRNFFYPHERWQFTGIRLAECVS